MEFQTENTIIDKLPLNVNKSNSKTHECNSMYCSTSSSNSESELDTSMDISINSFSSISHTNIEQKQFKDMSHKITCFYIKNKPKAYIGLNPDWYNQRFIELLSIKSKVSERYILLTLMKIRLNDSFSRLSDFFGISESFCCRIFNKTMKLISGYFKKIIHWPDKNSIQNILSIPFRYRYSDFQSIIDCLEIEIPNINI